MHMLDTIDNFVEICLHATALSNKHFLAEYGTYIDHEWKSHYICYDLLQLNYKELKSVADGEDNNSHHFSPIMRKHRSGKKLDYAQTVVQFELRFLREIQKSFIFIFDEAKRIEESLDLIEKEFDTLSDEQRTELIRKNDVTKSSYRNIRALYLRLERLKKFFRLNEFAINKMGKKFDKIVNALPASVNTEVEADQRVHATEEHVLSWECFESHEELATKAPQWQETYERLNRKCIKIYSKIFRRTHEHISEGELRYFKAKDGTLKHQSYLIGFKFGLAVAMGVWLMVDSLLLHGGFYYWTTPGLYVYSSIGGILVFKIMWVLAVAVWTVYNVNYIELFRVEGEHIENRPNPVLIVNHTMDLLIVFMACLIFFYRANQLKYAAVTSQYIAPLLLLFLFVSYVVYNLGPKEFHVLGMEYPSTNLFGYNTLKHAFLAPLYRVTFIDNFAADALTSFTRIIADALHAACWLVSGSFTHPILPPVGGNSADDDFSAQTISNYGSHSIDCTSNKMNLVVALFMIVPLWIRTLQCLRNFYDFSDVKSRKFPIFPHLLNAIKYTLSMLVVIYGVVLQDLDTFYYCLIVFTTMYKWLWDVFVDWGLCYTLFQKGFRGLFQTPVGEQIWLRPNLMYDRRIFYVVAIVLDLALRFVWVVSLAPESLTQQFAKSALQAFMGGLEIIRRGIWSMVRVENEHVNKLHGHALGVLIEKQKLSSNAVNVTRDVMAGARQRSATITARYEGGSYRSGGASFSHASRRSSMDRGSAGDINGPSSRNISMEDRRIGAVAEGGGSTRGKSFEDSPRYQPANSDDNSENEYAFAFAGSGFDVSGKSTASTKGAFSPEQNYV